MHAFALRNLDSLNFFFCFFGHNAIFSKSLREIEMTTVAHMQTRILRLNLPRVDINTGNMETLDRTSRAKNNQGTITQSKKQFTQVEVTHTQAC